MNRSVYLSIVLVLIMITGCARIIFRPERTVSTEAGKLLERVEAMNARRSACKGIGTIFFESSLSMPSMRFAWLCSLPDRIRMELLSPTGAPLLTVSADSTYFYYLPRDKDNRLYKKKAAGINLEKVISIPLTLNDITHLLAGAIPLLDFDTADRIDLADGNDCLRLKSYWPDRIEDVIFDKDTGRPVAIKFFRGDGNEPDYSALFSGTLEVSGGTVPKTITLTGAGAETVVITIHRFWLETAVPEEKFILSKPS